MAAARSPAPGCSSDCTAGLPRHRALPIATALLLSAGMAVVALTPWLWLGLLGMAFSGAFWIWMFAATNTAIQLLAAGTARPDARFYQLGHRPDRHRLDGVGAVAERAGIAATLAGCAALLAAGAWSLRNLVAAIDGQARRTGRSRRTRPRARACSTTETK